MPRPNVGYLTTLARCSSVAKASNAKRPVLARTLLSCARLAFTPDAAFGGNHKAEGINVFALGRWRALRRRSRWRRVRWRWISWWRRVVRGRRIICKASAAPRPWMCSRWAPRASAQRKSTDKQSKRPGLLHHLPDQWDHAVNLLAQRLERQLSCDGLCPLYALSDLAGEALGLAHDPARRVEQLTVSPCKALSMRLAFGAGCPSDVERPQLRLRSTSLLPTWPAMCLIFFMDRTRTRTPSPNKLEVRRIVDVGLDHRRIHRRRRPFTTPSSLAMLTSLSSIS